MLVILCVSDVRYLNGWSELLIKIMLSSGKHCKLEINDKIVFDMFNAIQNVL